MNGVLKRITLLSALLFTVSTIGAPLSAYATTTVHKSVEQRSSINQQDLERARSVHPNIQQQNNGSTPGSRVNNVGVSSGTTGGAGSTSGGTRYGDQPGVDLSLCSKRSFRITAYYSPLENQAYYYRPNYTAEVRLNGFGTNGASGAGVFNGMIAAPRTYAFGTQIYFPGWGVGQVEDRGQAIVQAGERNQIYDRIDIWVGRGEEGLRAALSFGVQYIDGYVCPQRSIAPGSVGFDLSRFPYFADFYERTLWIMSLEPGREDIFVYNLQRYLNKLGYLGATSITGNFGRDTKAAVCKFQQDHIQLSPNSEFCGTFGPQTRSAMRNIVRAQGITLSPAGVPGNRSAIAERLIEANRTSAVSTTQPTQPRQPLQSNQPAQTTQQSTMVAQAITPQSPLVTRKRLYSKNTIPQQGSLQSMNILQRFHHALFTSGDQAGKQFDRHIPFGEQSEEVMLLQRKLTWLGYYHQHPPTGIFDIYTRIALFAFQLDQGVLNGNEQSSLYGYFGPATRNAINVLQ